MQLIAEATDWIHEEDSNKAQRELQNWLNELSPDDYRQLGEELASKEGDWEKGMMGKALEESDRITSEIFSSYARHPTTGHSLSVITA